MSSTTVQYVQDQPKGFVNKIQNVALIGGSGQMGKHIILELLKNPQFNITALTRKGKKSVDEMPKGIHTIKEVEYDQHQSIVDALKGQDVLIVTLAVTAPRELPNKLVDAAVEAGVKWYIPNDWGYDMSHNPQADQQMIIGPGKEAHRQYLKQKGLPFTSISCGFWYEWSLSTGMTGYGFDINQRKVNLYENGQTLLITSTWVQAAKALASFLASPILKKDENDQTLTMTHWQNSFVHVKSFCLNQRQMLDAIQKDTKTKDSDWEINQVDVEKVWSDSFEKFKQGDQSAFGLCLYSRVFFADQPGNVDELCKKDMNLLGLQADESLGQATSLAVQMAKENYVGQFFQKLHSQ